MSEELVTYEVVDDIAVITLNRPDKMNAMSASLLDELEGRFDRAKRDDAVSCLSGGNETIGQFEASPVHGP